MNTIRTLLLVALALCAGKANALSVSITVMHHSNCGQNIGSMQAFVSGGTPPYTYAWSNGTTEPTNFGIGPGIYTVTVTDALLDEATDQATINSLPTLDLVTYEEDGGYCLSDPPYVSFYAGTENGMPPDPSTGTGHTPGPYTFDAVGYSESWQELPDACSWFSYYIISITNAPVGSNVTVNFTDGAGCPGTFSTTIRPPIEFPAMQVLNTMGSCSNGAIGSVTVSIAPTDQQFIMRVRNSVGAYVPNDCANNWVGQGNNVFSFGNLAAGTYHAVLDFDLYNQFANGTFCTDSLEIIIPDLGTLCGQVNGRVYVDNNANCALNGGEDLVPWTVVEVTPGPFYTTTNANGQYSITLPYGTYTFAEQHPVLEQSCPLEATVNGGSIQNNNIGCASGAPLDVQLMIGNGPARPGFELHYGIIVDNLTPSPTGTVTLTVDFDPALSYISASPAPTSVVGNTITWTSPWFTMTNAFQHKEAGVRFQIPPDVGLIGTTLTTTATIATANTDVDPANNSMTSAQLVTGSYDPNDKVATTSSQQENALYLIGTDEWIDYTIRFQNTGTDTAFNVIITDTLPATLDPATVQWGASSHTSTRSLSGAGLLKFIFPNILLPDSNVNEAASHGFVCFRIKPHDPVLPGTIVENIANIYFDFNPPVITEPSVLVAEFSTGVNAHAAGAMLISPNPAREGFHVDLPGMRTAQIILRDLHGRTVKTISRPTDRLWIDTQNLASGSYIVEAISISGYRSRSVVHVLKP